MSTKKVNALGRLNRARLHIFMKTGYSHDIDDETWQLLYSKSVEMFPTAQEEGGVLVTNYGMPSSTRYNKIIAEET